MIEPQRPAAENIYLRVIGPKAKVSEMTGNDRFQVMTDSDKFPSIVIRNRRVSDNEAIEALGARAFGPGRFSRAAFRLREGMHKDHSMCYVAEMNGDITGSNRLTPILIGRQDALMLGPLMVEPTFRNLGIGKELMNRALYDAAQAGHRYVVLVGDYAYYKDFGFCRIPRGRITFPGPADPDRILGLELVPGAAGEFQGPTSRKFVQEADQGQDPNDLRGSTWQQMQTAAGPIPESRKKG